MGKAIYKHEGRYENELSYEIEDELLVFKKQDNNYFYGYHPKSEKFGDIIAKYVKINELG